MTRAYSSDLRERVIEAIDGGLSTHKAAERFGIGVATAVRWHRAWRDHGEREARKQVPGYVVEYVTVKPESKILNKAGARLEAMTEGQPDLIHAVVSGNPGVEIMNFADKCEAELIVVGSHRPELQEYFLGSTASRVVRRASCAVLVLR